MKKVLAVALLDFRRLGFGLVSLALVAGLLPSLAKGLGADVPLEAILMGATILVGIFSGGSFGNDFNEGKSSFFFARPLSTGVLIAGRFVGMLGLVTAVFASIVTAYWLSSGRTDLPISLPRQSFAELFAETFSVSWALSLFVSLTIAARRTERKSKWSLRDFVIIPLRLTLYLTSGFIVFGLFADLMLRAYSTPTPAKIFFGSFVAAAFVTACVAMGAGRTDRLRITRFLNLGMSTYGAIATVVVGAAWTYILHPGPEAIEGVGYVRASADGRSAFVHAMVDRGDRQRALPPVFVVDIASGQARHLNADANQGPWTSADGGTTVWSEAMPFLFRPLLRYLGGVTNYRVRTSSGEAQPLPMPSKLPSLAAGPFSDLVEHVIPSPDGDVFAILWRVNRSWHLTFTSRSRGALSDLDLKADWAQVALLPSGQLRVATIGPKPPGQMIEVKDIDPVTGQSRAVATVEAGNNASLQFDAKASRALVRSQPRAGRTTIALVDLNNAAEPPTRSTVLLFESVNPQAVFLADGRVAAMSGSGLHWPLRVFSASGMPLLDIPVPDGLAFLARIEMFPGILAVQHRGGNQSELLLFDSANGAIVRRIPGGQALFPSENPPPPGSAAARLFTSGARPGGKLYELPSLTAEPRLLLPVAKQ